MIISASKVCLTQPSVLQMFRLCGVSCSIHSGARQVALASVPYNTKIVRL